VKLPASSRRLAAATLLLAPQAACSFVMRGPPDKPIAPDQEVRCESTTAPPSLDAAASVTTSVFGLAFVATTAGKTSCKDGCEGAGFGMGIGVALIAGGILYGISSARGFSTARRCREVLDAQAACREGDVTACLRLQPDPAPPQVPTADESQDTTPSPPPTP